MIKTKPVSSVSQFLEIVDRYQRDWQKGFVFPWRPWFRGEPHRSSPTRLRPKLYRSKLPRKDLRYEEQELRAEFRRHAVSLMQGPQPSGEMAHWEWYFLMQHHGVPTRLLDWTDGSLVGLYFAVSKRTDSSDDTDAAVYMLDPYWLNKRAFRDMRLSKNELVGVAFPDWDHIGEYLREDPFDRDRLKPKLPLAITPSHLSSRFAAQKSQFTIFGSDKGDLLLNRAKEKDSRIRVIPISGKSAKNLRAELARCGISESAVFPDVDGLGRELCMDFEARCINK